MRSLTIKILLLAGILLPGLALAQIEGAQVFIDPISGIRKVRVPVTQARSNAGVQWALTTNGRTVAYDSTRPEIPPGEEVSYRIFPFVSFGQEVRRTNPPNPVDPYGFIYREVYTDDKTIDVERVAYTWSDYQTVRDGTVDLLEILLQNTTQQVTAGENGEPQVRLEVPGTTMVFTITPTLSQMESQAGDQEAPIALTGATLLRAAAQTAGGPGGQAAAFGGPGFGGPGFGGPAGFQQPQQQGPGISDARSTAEWYFYYDQVYLWSQYIEKKIMEEDIEGIAELEGMQPDRLRSFVMTDFYPRMLDLRDEIAEREHDENVDFYAKMEDRKQERERYHEWRAEEAEGVKEFARAQMRQLEGREVLVEGRAFIISPEPLPRVQEGRVNIVSPSTIVTPYDLLTPEGDLRRPYEVD